MNLIFALAYAGYLLLGVTVISHCWRQPRRWLHLLTAAVVLLHVHLVWAWRFQWSLAYAWEKSIPGFLLFHTALVLILASVLVPLRWSRWCVLAAFPIVTAGAVAATFGYEETMLYRWPMFIAVVLTVFFCWLGYWRTR